MKTADNLTVYARLIENNTRLEFIIEGDGLVTNPQHILDAISDYLLVDPDRLFDSVV